MMMAMVLCVAMSVANVTEPTASVVRTETGVRLVRGERMVWNLELDAADGKPYVHPLSTPSGVVLTDLAPEDHRWHKGLWFSWKFINGVNYWETPDKCGLGGAGKTVTKTNEVSIVGQDVTVRLMLAYLDATGEVLSEKRTIRFFSPDATGGYSMSWEHEFMALKDITLDRTPPYLRKDGSKAGGYAGLTLRLSKLSAERFCRRTDGEHEVKFSDPSSGESIVMRAADEPSSACFYCWPDRRMLNLSPVYTAPLTLKSGEKLHLRYTVKINGAK